jgi:hypothetical protein
MSQEFTTVKKEREENRKKNVGGMRKFREALCTTLIQKLLKIERKGKWVREEEEKRRGNAALTSSFER